MYSKFCHTSTVSLVDGTYGVHFDIVKFLILWVHFQYNLSPLQQIYTTLTNGWTVYCTWEVVTISYDSDICRRNLGIEVLEKQLGIWAASRGREGRGREGRERVGVGVLWATSGSRSEHWWGSRRLHSFSNSKYFLCFKFNHICGTHNSISIMKLSESKTN